MNSSEKDDIQSKGSEHVRKARDATVRHFESHLASCGGLFTERMRRRLLGLPVGRTPKQDERTLKYDFWYDVRSSVKSGLTDLELFLSVASEKDKNQVINEETLRPVALALFHMAPAGRHDIARLLVTYGLSYLREKRRDMMTISHSNTIAEAIDLSDFLAEMSKPEGKRNYSQPNPKAVE